MSKAAHRRLIYCMHCVLASKRLSKRFERACMNPTCLCTPGAVACAHLVQSYGQHTECLRHHTGTRSRKLLGYRSQSAGQQRIRAAGLQCMDLCTHLGANPCSPYQCA